MSIDIPPMPAGTSDRLPDKARPFAAELWSYYQALPTLLAEGQDGRYVVIRGDQLYGVWDTSRDASQYGHEKFDDGKFLAQKIDSRQLPRWAELFDARPLSEAA